MRSKGGAFDFVFLEDSTTPRGQAYQLLYVVPSQAIALVTFFAIVALVTIVVVSTSRTWMRLFYAVLWAVSVVIVVLKFRNARQNRTEHELEQ